jgi:hypothetical protein
MTPRHFLHCRDCEEVFLPSPFDRAPDFTATPEAASTAHPDDCMAFLVRHARHALRTLRPTGGLRAYAGPIQDPMTVTYWQVADGDDVTVVRGWRAQVGEPRRYQVIAGRLVPEPPTVEIPEDEIRADVDRALYPGVATPRRLDAFVACFRDVVAGLDPAVLPIVYEVPTDPTLTVAQLPPGAMARVIAGVHCIFDADDAQRVTAHVLASTAELEGFTVLVRQPVRIELD